MRIERVSYLWWKGRWAGGTAMLCTTWKVLRDGSTQVLGVLLFLDFLEYSLRSLHSVTFYERLFFPSSCSSLSYSSLHSHRIKLPPYRVIESFYYFLYKTHRVYSSPPSTLSPLLSWTYSYLLLPVQSSAIRHYDVLPIRHYDAPILLFFSSFLCIYIFPVSTV